MVAAEHVSELLPQVLLRVSVTGAGNGRRRLNVDLLRARCPLLLRGDLPLLPHALENDEAACAGRVEVAPGRVGRGRADDAGDQRCFRECQIGSRLAEHLPRHRLHAVDASAQEHAVEVELENLALAELHLEHHRQRSLLGLARRRPGVGEKQRSCELLRDGASTLRAVRSQVRDDRAADADRIDSRMVVVAVVLDGDHGVFQKRGYAGQGNIAPLLVEPEPFPSPRVEKDGVADAAIQLMDGPAVPPNPGHRDEHQHSRDRSEDHLDQGAAKQSACEHSSAQVHGSPDGCGGKREEGGQSHGRVDEV